MREEKRAAEKQCEIYVVKLMSRIATVITTLPTAEVTKYYT